MLRSGVEPSAVVVQPTSSISQEVVVTEKQTPLGSGETIQPLPPQLQPPPATPPQQPTTVQYKPLLIRGVEWKLYVDAPYHKLWSRPCNPSTDAKLLERLHSRRPPVSIGYRIPDVGDWDQVTCYECGRTPALIHVDGSGAGCMTGSSSLYGTLICSACHRVFLAEQHND